MQIYNTYRLKKHRISYDFGNFVMKGTHTGHYVVFT